jgi:hypothetical protein
MPPKGYRKHRPEPSASPNDSPNDAYPVYTGSWPVFEPPRDSTNAHLIKAEAALVAAAKRLAARSPDIV